MGGTAQVRGGDREPAHRRRSDCGRGRAAGEGVQRDQAQRRPGREPSEHWRQRALDDAREDRNLETAEHEEVDQAGRDERALERGRDALANPEHDAQQHRRMGRG